MKRIVVEAYNTAKNLLTENRDLLEAFAKTLLEKETMDGAEIDALIQEAESKRVVQV